jgi:hypothetical protein
MRSMAARARALQGQRSQQAGDDALARIARLQHIAKLQDQASQVIAAAEAALDQSLLDCPTLDEAGDGTLRTLRVAH